MYRTFLCFVSLLSGVLSALTFEGPCPKVEGVKDINITALTDAPWYEIARFPDNWEGGEDCVVLSFEKYDNKIRFIINGAIDSKLQRKDGFLDVDKDTNFTGGLTFKSNMFESAEGVTLLRVTILAIVYDKYFVGFDCVYDRPKNLRHEYLWITSRTKQLDPKSKMEVENVVKSYNFIDMEKVIWDNFNEETCKVES